MALVWTAKWVAKKETRNCVSHKAILQKCTEQLACRQSNVTLSMSSAKTGVQTERNCDSTGVDCKSEVQMQKRNCESIKQHAETHVK